MRTFLPLPTAQAFLAKSESFLEQDEVSNNIILGVAYSLLDNPMKFGSKPFFGVIENNGVVCMADRRRPTKHGHVIGLVYTPKIYRNKGYATACVAELCRHILNSGKSFCSLFTDLSNPTSNGIYKKIGFKPLCDFHDYSFERK